MTLLFFVTISYIVMLQSLHLNQYMLNKLKPQKQGRRKHSEKRGHIHFGPPPLAKRALCRLKRGTLHTKFVKKWGHVPPVPPVPTSMHKGSF